MPSLPLSPINFVKQVWEKIAPLQLAERSWDNVGVIMESPVANPAHRQVLLTIDLTTAVCNEAMSLPSCSVVVSYHPPIFRGLKSLTLSDPLQASLLRLSAKGISVFSPHTSLDATPKGINTFLVQPFITFSNSGSSKPVTPSEHDLVGFEGSGMGRMVDGLDHGQGLNVGRVVEIVKEHLVLSHVQVATHDLSAPVRSIAACAGSGSGVLKDAKSDLLLTGEMSHHEVLGAVARGQSVILCNHSNTERPYLSRVLQPWLEQELNDAAKASDPSMSSEEKWEVLVSKEDADPLRTM